MCKHAYKLKDAVWKRDKYICVYCGKVLLTHQERTVDHVIPKSKGGKFSRRNLVTACKPCNNAKGSRTL